MPGIFLFIIAPLLEIAAFVVIGGKIGLGWTLAWLAGSAFLGFRLLLTPPVPSESPFENMFDWLCTLAAALLLILPGFISDFIALILLLRPLRRIIYALMRDSYMEPLKNAADMAQRYAPSKPSAGPTIDGDFKRVDSDDRKLM